MEGRPLEDPQLVERAQRGDTDAYGLLVRRYQGLAVRVGQLITDDAAEAEDAAQEAFVKAYYALGRLRPGAPFRPWPLRKLGGLDYGPYANGYRMQQIAPNELHLVPASAGGTSNCVGAP